MRRRPGDPGGVPAQGLKRREGAVAATLAVGLALLLGAIALVLAKSGVKETGSNRVRITAELGTIPAGRTLCQGGELVPAGTGSVRPFVFPTTRRNGPLRVSVRADADGRIVARGTHRADRTGDVVAVPVRPPIRSDTHASVCVTTLDGPPYAAGGEPAESGAATIGTQAVGGDIRIVYLQPHPRSWWSFAPTMIDRMGAGSRLSGTALAIVVLLLSITAAALGCAQLVRGRP